MSAPTELIGNSIGDVLYPRLSEAANNNENLTSLIKKATFSLAMIGMIPFGIIIIFGPELFTFVFGSKWLTAGSYAQWIALWSFFGFLNRPCIKSLPVLNAQRFHLLMSITMLISRIIVLIIGFLIIKDDKTTVALLGITGAMLNLTLILITLKISKSFDQSNLSINISEKGNIYE